MDAPLPTLIFGNRSTSTGIQQNRFTAKILTLLEPMARPRTPTALLELRGRFQKPSQSPQRSKERAACIDRLARSTPSPGIAGPFGVARNEGQGILVNQCRQTLIGLLGKIGFSPNDRVKLNLPQVKTQPV
jgi:hypothetical protein